jgi:ApbE superfamily uncharacterized protein (UPF0280 family)
MTASEPHQPRTYRQWVTANRLTAFQVTVKETDLLVHADKVRHADVRESVLSYRRHIEAYIERYPAFLNTLTPWSGAGPSPAIVEDMIRAGKKAGVGPMAAVAGAIAERVGRDLLMFSQEVIVENGGDIFLKTVFPVTIGLFAGRSPLSRRIALRVRGRSAPMGVCTSSGTVGHSLSWGRSDAVCVISPSAALSDAAATAVGNRIRSKSDVAAAMGFGQTIEGVTGMVVVIADQLAAWGDVEIVPG